MVVAKSSRYRSFDAFAKPIDGIRTTTTAGGAITLLAGAGACLLFISQLFLYLQVDIRHSFLVAPSRPLNFVVSSEASYHKLISNKNTKRYNKQVPDLLESISFIEKTRLNIFLHVTFPHVSCDHLDFAVDGASYSSGKFTKIYGRSAFTKRTPTEYDWAVATGQKDIRTTNKGLSKKMPSKDPNAKKGCTVRGDVVVPRIGGELSVTVSEQAWLPTLQKLEMIYSLNSMGKRPDMDMSDMFFNVSHYIHDISFGDQFPLAKNPLKDSMDTVENDTGMAVTYLAVKLIPTNYKRAGRRPKEMFQTSMTKHVLQPQTLAKSRTRMLLPGFMLQYDFSPLVVEHVESRENFIMFLSSLISIVGGVFVTIGLVSGCLVSSAQAVAKKMD